jgi:hypothetical protein
MRRQVEEVSRNGERTEPQRTARLRQIDARIGAAQRVLELRRLQVAGGVDLWRLPKDDLPALNSAVGMLPLSAQAALVNLAIASVVILPSSRRSGSKFNPDRVVIREREIHVIAS